MTTFVYILESEKHGRLYIGASNDVERRIIEHNQGLTKSTATGHPWKLLYKHLCDDRLTALRLERTLKSWKSSTRVRSWIVRNTNEM